MSSIHEMIANIPAAADNNIVAGSTVPRKGKAQKTSVSATTGIPPPRATGTEWLLRSFGRSRIARFLRILRVRPVRNQERNATNPPITIIKVIGRLYRVARQAVTYLTRRRVPYLTAIALLHCGLIILTVLQFFFVCPSEGSCQRNRQGHRR